MKCRPSFIISILLFGCLSKPNKEGTTTLKLNGANRKEILSLLTNDGVKFWDIVPANTRDTYNHTGELLNWMFTRRMELVEYKYQGFKRIRHIYGGDIVIGTINFDLRGDTIVLVDLDKEQYAVRKLSTDTLIVQHLKNSTPSTPIMFVKARDQKELPDW